MVPTKPSKGETPTTISRTTNPRSSFEISWRAWVSKPLLFSALLQRRCLSARRRSRLNEEGCCWQMRRSIGRSSAVRNVSSAPSTAMGMTLTARKASPRSMINVSPITDAIRSTPIIIFSMIKFLRRSQVNSFCRIVKSKSHVPVFLRDIAAHFQRPRAVGRGVENGLLANQTEQIGHFVPRHSQIRDAAIRVQPKFHHDLARTFRGTILQQLIPACAHGVDKLPVVIAVGSLHRIKRRFYFMPVDAAFLP